MPWQGMRCFDKGRRRAERATEKSSSPGGRGFSGCRSGGVEGERMEERKTGNITTRVQFLMDIYLGLLSPEKKNISILKKHTKSFTTYFKLFNIYTG